MTAVKSRTEKGFRMALLMSFALHATLAVVLGVTGTMGRTAKQGMIHYVNLIGGPGGGGGGDGTGGSGPGPGGGPGGGGITAAPAPVQAQAQPQPKTQAKAPAKKESLRDLTLARKAASETPDSLMHYPTDKPRKAQAKKAAITKPEPQIPASETGQPAAPASASQFGSAQSGGYGLRFGTAEGGGGGTGTGGGGGGGGFGGGGGDPYGVESFPFTYYLQMVSDKISANWFTSLSDAGQAGQAQTQVYFRIYRTGQVSEVKVETTSGAEAFDLAAVRAIQASSPFPKLPAEYDGQYLGIHLIFEHAK